MVGVIDKLSKIKVNCVVYKHDGNISNQSKTQKSYSLSILDADAIDDFFADLPYRRNRSHSLLEDGHVGMVLHEGSEWMSFGWILTPEATKAPRTLPDWICSEECYWLFNARTREAYRGCGLFSEINRVRLRWIYDRDPDATVYTDTGVDNVARYGIESSGFEPAGLLTVVRIELPGGNLRKWGWWNRTDHHPQLPS